MKRALSVLQDDELELVANSFQIYAKKIQEKIDEVETAYREKQFRKQIDTGTIICHETYSIPPVITPTNAIDSIPYSLYESEADNMNGFERQVLDAMVGTENIRWWHRITDRRGFYLNGWFRHYPDFMVMTKSGKLILVETKGDHLDGCDSQDKLLLGRTWQNLAGQKYKYFMVFDNKDIGLDGAYKLDTFIEILSEM